MLSMKSEDPDGFIDTGLTPAVVDPRVYASVSVVREWARKLGMVDGSIVEGLERRVADLEAQLAEADNELNAIHILKARGYTPAKKPGRPAKAA
jgi:hypothetical protein